jgi:cysteinyl-tRNA synthetase
LLVVTHTATSTFGLLAVHFSGTITLGAVLLAAAAGVFALVKAVVRAYQGEKQAANFELASQRAEQLHSFLQEALDREKRVEGRLDRATQELVRAKDQITEQATEIEQMRQAPNLAEVIESFHQGFRRTEEDAAKRTAAAVASLERFVGDQLAHHEQRAQDRQERIIEGLDAIVDQLRTLAGRP